MNTDANFAPIAKVEWQTLGLISASYLIWLALLAFGDYVNGFAWVALSAINVTLFMSITHEVVHGHPTRNERLNRLLILLPIGWSIPYERFRGSHLEHHETEELTDPFDDPETWYLSKHQWMLRNAATRAILTFNNTLFGRMLIGPLIGLGRFYFSEFISIARRENNWRANLSSWLFHGALCLMMMLAITKLSSVPAWQWVTAIYLGHSLLLVRTFLEHQAAPDHSQRTVIIEMPCPIAFLFLFNNYHFVHHDKPHLPWYRLPAEYRANREAFLAENGAYVYRSYAEIFRMYFFHIKEPVQHPFLRTS